MRNQLLIVNNSLKDLRGHFFETSLAVAEAARDRGWHPVLGAHVSCPGDVIPDWLAFRPVFSTDHWMVGALPKALQLAEYLLPLGWHQSAQRLLRTPWRVFNSGKQLVATLSRHHEKESLDPLQVALRRAGIAQEFDLMQRFRGDLEKFLLDSACQADDHVFLPTAHGRELAAIQRLIADWPPQRTPIFHLEFRHDLEKFRYQIRHRVFFEQVRKQSMERIRLYSDTEELADEYATFSGLPFGVLPIPFRARLLVPQAGPTQPLCIAYFGDVRDEKGFHWLPDLVDALLADGAHRARFLIQASLDPANRNPRSRLALRKLQRMPGDAVQLIGEDGPLTPADYYRFVSQADVLLCPYDGNAYRSRSSGTFTEALAAGIPTVVPANTWMARQQPADSGATFADLGTFIGAVQRITADHERFRSAAEKEKDRWLGIHSPENLVSVLLDDTDLQDQSCRQRPSST